MQRGRERHVRGTWPREAYRERTDRLNGSSLSERVPGCERLRGARTDRLDPSRVFVFVAADVAATRRQKSAKGQKNRQKDGKIRKKK